MLLKTSSYRTLASLSAGKAAAALGQHAVTAVAKSSLQTNTCNAQHDLITACMWTFYNCMYVGPQPELLLTLAMRCCTAASSCSCSYEGATAAAASDSVMVNQGGRRGRRGTVIANSMMTASTAALPRASRRGSFGTTAQPVSAMALSGNPNGRIQIAQVGEACNYVCM
jgi:hypothetical protein